MSLLGLDVGMQRCRGIVIDEGGQILARAQQNYVVSSDAPNLLPTRAIWTAAQDVIRRLASTSRQNQIRALSISGSTEAWVPLAMDHAVLGGCLLPSTTRIHPILKEALDQVGAARWFDVSGRVPDADSWPNRVAWWRQTNPTQWHHVWRFAPVTALLSALLGGSTICDHTLASGTGLLDTGTGEWSGPLLRALQIPVAKLPELRMAGEPVGTVAARLARTLGLPAEIRIVLGGHDLICGALGAGAVTAGTGLLHLGASLMLMPVFGALPLRSMMLQCGYSIDPHLAPELFLSVIEHAAGGRLLTWFCEQIIAQETRAAQKRGYNIYERLLAEMPSAPSSLLALPENSSHRPNGAAERKGVMIGIHWDATRGETVKALLEAGAYALARTQHDLEGMGIRLERYRVTGSGARSEPWMQMVANVLDRPLEQLAITETKTLGAALLAGMGCGTFDPDTLQAGRWAPVLRTYAPDPQQHALYRARIAAH